MMDNGEPTQRRLPPKTRRIEFMGIVQTPLVQIFIALIVVGVLLWLVNTFIPMAGSIKSLLNAVVIIVVVVWLLNIFGLMHYITNFHVNRVG